MQERELTNVYSGSLAPSAGKFAIVCARFNTPVTMSLFEAAKKTLLLNGVAPENISEAWVPGAYEVPLIAQKFAAQDEYVAVICLGAVIKGDTPHFDFVAGESARGIMDLSLRYSKPIIFGILTVNTEEQAWERATWESGNKGSEAALTAIEMVNLAHRIET
jgi:6,7-dimethyl-8-ribityllumazine synthase